MLKGKIAVLTGVSGNLGPIWREILWNNNCEVFEIDLPKYDITDDWNVRRAMAHYVTRYGQKMPSILINNAGVDNPPSSGGNPDELFWSFNDHIMQVNYYGTKRVCRIFGEQMRDGHVVNVGSYLGSNVADTRRYPADFDKPVDYGASKAAIHSLTRWLAVRWAEKGLRVNTLSPAAVEVGSLTEQSMGKYQKGDPFREKWIVDLPTGTMVTVEDLTSALLFLVTCGINVTGQEMVIDGGMSLR